MPEITTRRHARRRSGVLLAITMTGTLLAPSATGAADGSPDPIVGPSSVATVPDEAVEAAAVSETAATEGALGVYFDFSADQYVVVWPASNPTIDLAAPGFAGLRVRAETRDITQARVDQIETALLSRSFDPAARTAVFGYWFDPRRGSVVVDVAGPLDAFASVAKQFGRSMLVRSAPGGREWRNDDLTPHWGGSEIQTPSDYCTAGYTVKNAAGTRFMVTAAHCGNQYDSVTGGTGLGWGTLSPYGPYPAYDTALIGGSSYAGAIYTGNFDTQGHQPVKAAANPSIGSTSYCHSGWATDEHCGHHLVAFGGTFCDQDGCTGSLGIYQDGVRPSGTPGPRTTITQPVG